MVSRHLALGCVFAVVALPAAAADATDRAAIEALIAKHAKANGVPFSLVHRVVRRESNYNSRASHRGNLGLIPTRVKADSFQGFQNGASSESCPSASATGPMHDAQCGLVFRGARNPALRLSWAVSPYHFRQSVSGPTSRQVA